MILVDTGAFYALATRSDRNHASAARVIKDLAEPLVTHTLILAEIWYLLETRVGRLAARKLAERVVAGGVGLLSVESTDIASALTIERRYSDLDLGLADAVSLALCERERIEKVFTFDRRDFGSYRPSFAPALKLLP
jgi:hypothetical protein